MKKKIVVENLSNTLFTKVKKRKADDGFADAPWSKWLEYLVRDIKLVDRPSEVVDKHTRRDLKPLWLWNFARNLPYIQKGMSIKELVETGRKKPAIIVGAGPSIHNHKHLEMLANSNFKGVVVSTDRMLKPLLEHDVIPDYVVSLDASKLTRAFFEGKIVKEHAHQVKAALSISVPPKVTRLIKKIGMPIYWWSYSSKEDYLLLTRSKKHPNGLLSIMTGGNCGTAAWVFSWAILKCNPTCLIGFDFSYPEGTKLEDTGYYSGALLLSKNKTEAALIASPYYETVYHPVFKTKAKIDAVFNAYRRVLLASLDKLPKPALLYNCSEGGTLFHKRMVCIPFREFLEKVKD